MPKITDKPFVLPNTFNIYSNGEIKEQLNYLVEQQTEIVMQDGDKVIYSYPSAGDIVRQAVARMYKEVRDAEEAG